MRIGLLAVDSHNYPNYALMKYDAKIRWSIGLAYEDRTQSSANIEVHSPDFDHYFSGETGVTITADNIMDFEKELTINKF